MWTPSEETEVIWRGEYSDLSQNSGTVYTTTESVYNAGNVNEAYDLYGDISTDVTSLEERDLFGTSIEINHDFENFTLTSISSYRSMNVNFINDEDGSSDPGHYFASENTDDQDQFSQEFRFTGETENMKWTVGAGYSKEHVDHTTFASTNTNTLENFAIYNGLLGDVDALTAINPALTGAALGIDSGSSEQEIAEVINGARAMLQGAGADGIVLAGFLAPQFAAAPDPIPGGSGNPFGGLNGVSCAGGGQPSAGVFANNALLGGATPSQAVQAATAACLLPQVQAGLSNDPRWVESVRNTGSYESMAVYGDFTYSLNEQMNLSAGLRYTYDEKDFTVQTGYNSDNAFFTDPLGNPIAQGLFFFNNGVDGENVVQEYNEDWDALSGRLVLDYFINDNTMVYGSLSTGFKSGGFNSLGFGPSVEPSFDQEEVTNFELGFKGDFFDGSLRFNAAAYYYEYENKQDLVLIGPANAIPSYNITTSDAEGQGVDLEVYWSITEQLFVSANYSYLDTEITDYTIVAGEDDITGDPLANTPENKFYIMGEYTIPFEETGDLVLRTDYSWTDERVGQLRGESIDDFFLINARATFNSADDSWAVAAWVNNVTDEEDLRDFTGPASAIGSHTVARRNPRMYGVDVTYRF